MIYDCFTYFNEIELLELRLRTLDSAVDYFVIAEANRTFSGKKRSLHFPQYKHLFSAFDHKIIYIPITDMPDSDNPWDLEYHQRNGLLRGLVHCHEEDTILLSDVDEIPNPGAISHLHHTERGKRLLDKYPIAFAQRRYNYFVNCVEKILWQGTMAIKYKYLKTPQALRDIREFAPRIRDGGWHFSYLGGVQRIIEKIRSFAHQELNTVQNNSPEYIRSCIEAGSSDIQNQTRKKYTFVRIDSSYPPLTKYWVSKYPHLLHPVQAAVGARDAYPEDSHRLFYNFIRWYWFLLTRRIYRRH